MSKGSATQRIESRVRDVHVTNKHRNFCAQRSKRRQGSLRRLAVGKLQKCVATHRAQRIRNTACMLEKRTNDTHSHNLRNAFAAIFSKKKKDAGNEQISKKKSMPRCHEVSASCFCCTECFAQRVEQQRAPPHQVLTRTTRQARDSFVGHHKREQTMGQRWESGLLMARIYTKQGPTVAAVRRRRESPCISLPT